MGNAKKVLEEAERLFPTKKKTAADVLKEAELLFPTFRKNEPKLQGPDYKAPVVAPIVSNPKVKNQGNLLSMNVAAQKDKRADVDDQIAALEAEKRTWENEKAIWENSQFRGQKWDEAEKQIRDIQQRIDTLQKSTVSQDVIDEAQSWQQGVQAYRQQKEEEEMLLRTTATQNTEEISALEEQAKVYELQIQQLQRSGVMKGELYEEAQKNYQDTMKQIDELRMGLSQQQIDRAAQLQEIAGLEGVTNYVGFENMSKYHSTRNGQTQYSLSTGYAGESGWDDMRYDVINRNEEAVAQAQANASTSGEGLDAEVYALKQMTDEEIAIYNYWYVEDKQKADRYIEMLMPELTKRQMNESLERYEQYAQESPVAASAFSTLISPARGLSYVGQAADFLQDGKIDENAGYNIFARAGTQIRETVGEDIEKALGEKWGKVGSFTYELGMSMGDFLMAAALSGGVGADTKAAETVAKAIATTIMGTGAAAQSVVEAKQRGLNDRQAFTLGTIAGIAEAATEKYSIEELLNKAALGRGALTYMLRNAVAEGSEEAASGIINTVADVLISRDKSQWQEAVDAYKAMDYAEDHAWRMALTDQAMAIGLDAIGGAISGGIMGGTGAAANEIGYNLSRPSGQRVSEQQIMDLIGRIAEEETAQPAQQVQQTEVPQQSNMAELERSGVEAGADEQTIRAARRISDAIGREIIFYNAPATKAGTVNGRYEDGKIYINTQSKNPLAQIISHELTHSVELADVYDRLAKTVLNRMQSTGADLEQLRQNKIDLYKRNGVQLQNRNAVDAELVAEYVEKNLLTNEQQIMDLVQQDRSLAQRIRDWIDSLLAKLGNEAAQERAFLTNARNLYSKALEQTTVRMQQQTQTEQAQQTQDVQTVETKELNKDSEDDILQKTLDMIQFSISEEERTQRLGDLRSYLSGNMSMQELNSRIGGRSAQQSVQTENKQLSTEARKIQNAARRQQVSVEQYLQNNWELFDVDGEWNQAAREALDDERGARSTPAAYSITEPFADEAGNTYEAAVLLDTDAFDGVAPRSWWKVLKEKLENRVEQSTFIMPVLDENGEVQNLEFAKPEDRVRKNDSKEHSVISELYQTSDNISKLAAIHVDEVVEVSGEKEPYYTGPDGHGWLDENGWLHRTAYVINSKNGNIYQITMDIAKARDGRVILYALNGKTKKVGTAKVNSLKLRGSTQRTNFEDRVSRGNEKVKYSFSEETDQIEDEHEMAFDALLRDAEREQEAQAVRPERLEDTRRSLESYMAMQDRAWAQEAKEELAAEKISAQFSRRPTSLREDLREAKSFIMRKMVDAGEAVARIGKTVGDKGLYHYYNMARASSNAAINMITDKRTDIRGNVTGEGLDKLLKTVREKGNDYYKRFQLYLYHMHNIDRMSRENPDRVLMAQAEFQEFTMMHPELSKYAEFQIEQMAANPDAELYFEAREYIAYRDAMRKAENTRNKPVFGFEVTAEDSRTIVQRLANEHPEFAEEAQKVYDYIDNLLRYRVDSGLITEEDYEMLKSIYPHYVPTYRSFEWDNQPQTKQKGKVQIGKTIQRATGGDAKLMPLHKALSQQTMSVVREGSKNRFGQRLMQDNENGRAYEHIYGVAEYDNNFSENTFDRPEDEELKKTNTFVVRQDGKLWELTVSPALYEAVQALSTERDEANTAVRLIRRGNDLFKKLVTGYNPTFLVRNLLRDLQDASFYSADLSEFAKQYPQAIREMQKDGRYWQQYKALGGTYSSVFDYETGDVDKGGRLKQNTIGRIETLNQAIEQAPRLAEFMATVKKAEKDHGQATMDDLMEAMYNAADITVNFGRAGTLGKKLNANFVPFLNPGIQGFSKMVRSVTETKGMKDWARLAAKAALFGVAPTLLNALIYHDDDEWDDLKDRDKDVYYLFKIRDGLWMKLPKGRTLSLIGMTADRAIDVAQGEDVDWGGYIETAAQQSAPANPFENNIAAAWFNTNLFDPDDPGRTWYGTDIESQRLQNYAPEERYDASTDVVSKWLGKVTNLSPAKINYLLDQYTGVAGDVLLPLLSPQAERDMFSAAFTIDSNYSNRFSNEFYEMADELTYRKNMTDATGVDNILNRFWSRQSTAVSEVNKAIRQIEADTELKDKEKKELTAAQYGIRNALMENALDTLDAYTEAAEHYYNASTQVDENDRIDEAYREANREIFGAEYAIQTYNKDVYETATELFNNSGIGYDAFYDFYFAQKDIGETGYEKTNEKRNLIMQSGLTDEQKEALYTKYVSDTRADDIAAFRDAGMGMDTFMQIQNQYAAIENMQLSSSEKRTEFSRWLFKQPLNAQQDAVASEVFSFYSHISAQESRYEKLIDAGLSDEAAYNISNALFGLEPMEGKSQVSDVQKYKAIADAHLSDEDTLAAFGTIMGEKEMQKVQAGYDMAVSPRVYANVKYTLSQFDADGSGSYNQQEIEEAIDAYASSNPLMRLNNGDKAILWQMLTGSTSAKNNPYSRNVAQDYLDRMQEE